MTGYVYLLFVLVAATEQHRVIVTFFEREQAQKPWQFGSIAKIHNQYGRRLVLEFEAASLDVALIKQVIKPNELIEIIEACESGVGQGTQVFDSEWDKLENTEPYGMHTQGAWKAGLYGRQELVVGILDSGISQSGKGLFSHYVAGYDMISYADVWSDGTGRDPDPTDSGGFKNNSCASEWHGTICASTLAANGSVLGYMGVAPNITLLDMQVLGLCNVGWADDITDAITWAIGAWVTGIPFLNPRPAQILSISIAGKGNCSSFMQSAINMSFELGVIVVVAAGNDHSEDPSQYWPCNCLHVVCVAASTRAGELASFSNRGKEITVTAPGDHINVIGNKFTAPNLGWEYWGGTSFSTPNVAGMLALYWSMDSNNTFKSLAMGPGRRNLDFIPLGAGSGAGLITSVSPLPPVTTSLVGTLPCLALSEYRNITTNVCLPCPANQLSHGGPFSFVWPPLRNAICVSASFMYQNQSVFNCTGDVWLFWHETRWWYGGSYFAAAEGTYWGSATSALAVGQTSALQLLMLTAQSVEMCFGIDSSPTLPAVTTSATTTTALAIDTTALAITTTALAIDTTTTLATIKWFEKPVIIISVGTGAAVVVVASVFWTMHCASMHAGYAAIETA